MSTDSVYLLWHIDEFDDEKLIGVYRTEGDADAAIKRVKEMPGFMHEGGKFQCAKYELDQDHWRQGFHRPKD
jgi:hypothetical protein